MKQQIDLIIFDWDGTLMDSERRIVNCMRAAIEDLSLPTRTDDELKNIIGLGLKEALRALYPDATETVWNELVAGYRRHYLYEDQTPSVLFDGVAAMLNALLQQGFFLAIATGKGRAGLDHALSQTNLEQHFHATRCADETRSKPHPLMLEELIDYFAVEQQHVLMVGDTEYDLEMANNAKIHAVGVNYGVHESHRLQQHKPLACVDTVNELHSWFNQHIFTEASNA